MTPNDQCCKREQELNTAFNAMYMRYLEHSKVSLSDEFEQEVRVQVLSIARTMPGSPFAVIASVLGAVLAGDDI